MGVKGLQCRLLSAIDDGRPQLFSDRTAGMGAVAPQRFPDDGEKERWQEHLLDM